MRYIRKTNTKHCYIWNLDIATEEVMKAIDLRFWRSYNREAGWLGINEVKKNVEGPESNFCILKLLKSMRCKMTCANVDIGSCVKTESSSTTIIMHPQNRSVRTIVATTTVSLEIHLCTRVYQCPLATTYSRLFIYCRNCFRGYG